MIDGHKLQLNTFFICLILVVGAGVAVQVGPHTNGAAFGQHEIEIEIEVKILIANNIDKHYETQRA